jgi:arylsulfatase A-like enzyme
MRAFAWAWLLYGVLEALLAVAFPALRARLGGSVFGHVPGPTLALLAFYPLAGAALGALVERALRLRAARGPALALLAAGSVVVALLANLALRDDLGSSGAVLAVFFAGLFALGALDARANGAEGTRWVLASPWVAVPLAVASAWLLRDLLLTAPLAQRLGAVAATLALGLALAAALRRPLTRAWRGARGTLRGGLAAAAALGALCTALLQERPPALPPLAPAPIAGSGAPVVLVVLDTVRADHLSTYGYARETDPTLAALARESLVFEQVTTPGDMTLTSHASLFTGQSVARHGVTIPQPVLADSAVTLAERLGAAGYHNAFGVSANCGWIGPGHGIEQGFAHWDARCGRATFAGVRSVFLRAALLEQVRRRFFPEQAGWRWRSAAEISDEALRVLAHVAPSHAPFLLFLNYMDVHRPIQPPREYQTRYPGRLPRFDMARDWSALYDEVNRGERAVTPAERAHLESQYDGALAYLDAQLARVFADLRARDLWERSLIVVTADHGEGFGDHQTFGHGHGVYQDVVSAPLLVKPPGPPAARRIATPVSLVDVLPTVLAALALPAAEDADGVSLLGEIPESRALFAESYDGKGVLARALRRGAEKWVEHRGRAPALYDLASDPGELRDLSGERADAARGSAAELARWVAAQAGGGSGPQLTPEETERLKALGYLQ